MAEARERRSELALSRLAALVEGSHDLVAVVDASGRLVYVSPSHTRVLGFESDELVGALATSVVHPDDLARVMRAFEAQMISGDAIVPVAYRHRHADGSWRWVEVVAVDRRDDPVVGGIVTHSRDITERRAAEEALRASEEQFRALLAAAPIGIVQSNEEWELVRCNARFAEITGRGEAELLGPPTRWLEIIHPDDHAAVNAERISAERVNWEFRAEIRVLRPDGQVRWAQVRSVPLLDADGARYGHITTLDDITAQRDAEAAFQDSEARFRAAFEHAPIGMGLASADGRLLAANQVFAEILGRSRAELIGMAIRDFTHPEDWADTKHHIRSLFAGEFDSYHLDKRYVHVDGHTVWVSLSVSLVRGPDGEPRYMIGQIQDITQKRAVYEVLEHQARHDALTGVANRAQLDDRLQRIGAQPRRGGRIVAVLFADLDHFKALNDRYGHHTGDRVLVEIGRRLRAELRPGDLVCRIGGDEFVIICEQIETLNDACDVARRVLEVVRRPIELDSQRLHVTVSIGIAPIDPTSPETALRAADAAMYAAKQAGRDRFDIAAPGCELKCSSALLG